jgi:hypothetical protein
MNNPWFKRQGIYYIPVNWVGWFIFILLIAYFIYSFIDIESQSHSVIDILINFLFNALFGIFIYQLIGYFSVKKNKKT